MPLFKVLVDNDVVKPEPEPVVEEESKEEEKSEDVVVKQENETAESEVKDAAADSVTPKDDADAEADDCSNAKNNTQDETKE